MYEIEWKSKGTSVAGQLWIWRFDGTTSFLYDELPIAGVTPSTTVASERNRKAYANLGLKSTEALFISVTVAQDLNAFAAVSDL